MQEVNGAAHVSCLLGTDMLKVLTMKNQHRTTLNLFSVSASIRNQSEEPTPEQVTNYGQCDAWSCVK
jgi:hypothetical protein